MKSRETVRSFCERFDAIVREYEVCEDAVKLTSQELRFAFYQAVSPIFPELRVFDVIKRQTSQEMSLKEIKSFISQLAVEKKAVDLRSYTTSSTTSTKKKRE